MDRPRPTPFFRHQSRIRQFDPAWRGGIEILQGTLQQARGGLGNAQSQAIGTKQEQTGRFWNGSARILEWIWNRDRQAFLNTDEETPVQRHEVPTHLNIEDKAFAGLTMRQLMVAIIGLALAYAAMSEAPLPLPIRLAAGGMVLLATAAVSLWRPAGRPLEDWAFVLLQYVSVPRIVVWRVRTPREETLSDEPRFEVVVPDRPATGIPGEGRALR